MHALQLRSNHNKMGWILHVGILVAHAQGQILDQKKLANFQQDVTSDLKMAWANFQASIQAAWVHDCTPARYQSLWSLSVG